MDRIHCLLLYNLQTSVLSTATQKMKLLSKYIAKKTQHGGTEWLLYIIQKVMASVRENNFLKSAKGRRPLNTSHNMKAMKKICMAFFITHQLSSLLVCRSGDKSLHIYAIQVNIFHVNVFGPNIIGLQTWNDGKGVYKIVNTFSTQKYTRTEIFKRE